MSGLKIKVSNAAYEDMINLLKFHNEYTCFRLYYESGCCKTSKVQLMLDKEKTSDICDNIEGLTFCYDEELIEKVQEVMILLEKGNYLIKSKLKFQSSSCKNCSKSCNCH